MSTLIKINIRKEDGSYVNYMGSISDHFDFASRVGETSKIVFG
jgi:hypothetical protein